MIDNKNSPPVTKFNWLDGLNDENNIKGPSMHNKINKTKVQPNPHFIILGYFWPRGVLTYPFDYILVKYIKPVMSSNLNH